MDILKLKKDENSERILKMVKKLNADKNVHGIMIQLPIPDNFSERVSKKMIDTIDIYKDVDGLRDDSIFTAPVVKAVISVVSGKDNALKTAIIGANGFEGKKITKKLRELGYGNIIKLDKSDDRDLKKIISEADMIISAAGQPDLVQPEMIKEGIFLIDVGSPKGDISRSCYSKAAFVSPVPGGIGPVTISYLMENLLLAAGETKRN
jgi:methylenetetrahydrofolate dehydrogenase (NADP+)/methenyltetrahydrofolate cyclohydrolase